MDHTTDSYKQEEFKEKVNDLYKLFIDFETMTSEPKHMPQLCWVHNDDIQRECVGIHICAVDMSNALPTDKHYSSIIAHYSDDDCRSIV